MTTIYTCSSASTTESDLILAGATQLSISYQYELVTTSPSEDAAVDEAIERVQSAMLQSVAEQSGLIDCGGSGLIQKNNPWRRRLKNTHGSDSDGEVAERIRLPTTRRRSLRTGGRGSNSIVGLSSNPPDEPSDIPCRADDAMTTISTQVLDDPFEESERLKVTPGLAGSVIMGDDLDSSSDVMIMAGAFDGSEIIDTVKSNTRIDGVNVQRGANSNANQQQQQLQQRHDNNNHRDLKNKNKETGNEGDNSNDNFDMLAFNYISTQSIPIERSSYTSHNPLSPPTVFQQSSKIISNARPNDSHNPITLEMPNNNNDAPSTLPSSTTSSTKKCTVIRGRMSVYTSASEAQATYENLRGRIFDALAEDVNNNNHGYADDAVSGVLMLAYDDGDRSGVGVVDREDPISESTGYASAIEGGLGGNNNNNGNTMRENSNSVFTAPMAVLVTLGCVLIALVALFVRTSKPKQQHQQQLQQQSSTKSTKKKKIVSVSGSEPSLAGTYHDDEVEMDAKDLNTRISSDDDDGDVDGDYSVEDQFSISSAKDESVYPLRLLRSFGSRSKKNAAAASSSAMKDGNKAVSSSAAAAVPPGKSSVADYAVADASDNTTRIVGRGSARAASKGAAAEDDTDVPYIQSSILGLFAAQPRAETPENEVELDYSSVYDCDDGVESVISPDGRVANTADRSMDHRALPPLTEDEEGEDEDVQPAIVRPSKSFLGSLLRGRAKSRNENYGELDEASDETDAPSLEEGGKRPVYGDDDEASYAGPVDMDAIFMSARSSAYATANRNALRSNNNKTATPGNITRNVRLGCTDQSDSPQGHSDNKIAKPLSSSLLQFFTARNQYTTPHTEVEAGLRPFDECSEYSTSVAGRQYGQEVDSDYFFGQCGTESDRVMLSDEARQTNTRMVRKFSKMIQRAKVPVFACDGGDDAREIHQIYSQDMKDDVTPRKESLKASVRSTPRKESRKASGRSTPVYMMQKMPSTLRPVESYGSPSGLSVRTRSQLSQARSNTVREEGSHEGGDITPCIVIADDDSVAICDAGMMCDSLVPECLR